MKRFFSLFIVLLAALSVSAKPVTSSEAAGIAGLFVESAASEQAPLRCVAARALPNSQVPYYVFTGVDGKGFVIVAGDDCAYPVLGYAESGYLDMEHLPSNVQGWLSKYESQLAAAIADSLEPSAPIAAAWVQMRQPTVLYSRSSSRDHHAGVVPKNAGALGSTKAGRKEKRIPIFEPTGMCELR